MPTYTPQEAARSAARVGRMVAEDSVRDGLIEARGKVLESIGGNFASQSEPDGGPWPPRKPNKHDDGHPILDDTGALKAAATGVGPGAINEVSARELVVGVDKSVELGGIPGVAAHNFGYPPNNLPERHFLSATEATLDECEDVIGDWLEGEIERLV